MSYSLHVLKNKTCDKDLDIFFFAQVKEWRKGDGAGPVMCALVSSYCCGQLGLLGLGPLRNHIECALELAHHRIGNWIFSLPTLALIA